MMLSLVMLIVITVHDKKLKRHYIFKMARGRLYTKEREKGRQCAERLIFSLIGICLTIVIMINLLSSFLTIIKKVIGKFKDEAAGQPIISFVGLKSKMYSYRTESKDNKTAKGVKKNVIGRDLDHLNYLN